MIGHNIPPVSDTAHPIMSSNSDSELMDDLLDITSGPQSTSRKRKAAEEARAVPLKKRLVDDEGPGSSSARRQKGSANIFDDNDSEESDDDDMFDDGYDSDFMGDEEDRRRILALPEFERELELNERAEQRQRLQELRAVREKRRQKQRKAHEAVSEKTQRARGGRKGSRKDALADLRKQKHAAEQRKAREAQYASEESESGSDDEDEIGSDSEYEDIDISKLKGKKSSRSGQKKRRAPTARSKQHSESSSAASSDEEGESAPQDDVPATFEHFSTLGVVTRSMLYEAIDKPWFDDAVKGMYVRVSIGVTENTKTALYQMCRIVSVEEGQTKYAVSLGSSRSKKKYTLKKLLLDNGIAKRNKLFNITFVSDQACSEQEVSAYLSGCRNRDRSSEVTVGELQRLRDRWNTNRSKILTEADVSRLVVERQKLNPMRQSRFAERLRLEEQIATAMDEGNTSLVDKLKGQMEQVMTQMEDEDRQHKQLGVQKVLGDLNKKNRLRNMNIFIEDGEQGSSLRKLSSPDALANGGSPSTPNDTVDVFSRRQVGRQNYWAVGRSESGQAAESSQAASESAKTPDRRPLARSARPGASALSVLQVPVVDVTVPVPRQGGIAGGVVPTRLIADKLYSLFLS